MVKMTKLLSDMKIATNVKVQGKWMMCVIVMLSARVSVYVEHGTIANVIVGIIDL
jgi:hypothetical protein